MPDDPMITRRPELITRFTRSHEEAAPFAEERIGPPAFSSQMPRRRKLDPEDAEMRGAHISPDVMDTLTAEERAEVEEHAPALRAALVRAMLVRTDPSHHVMTADDDDIEPTAIQAIAALDDRLVERLMPRVDAVLRDERKARRMLGASAVRNLREPLRIKRIRPRIPIRAIPIRRPEAADRRDDATPEAPVYTRALVELRAVHCVRITEPRDNPDEMVLGTVLVGAGGNVNAGRGLDLGTFYNGDLFSYGELPIGQFSLRSTDGYPKHMYVLFKLVETDADGRETARDLTKAIGGLAQGIVGALAGPQVGVAAGTLVAVIGGFFEGLVDEDEFPIVGKRLTLDHMHSLGGAVGPRERTGDINGHGGRYRIGYRWLMGA